MGAAVEVIELAGIAAIEATVLARAAAVEEAVRRAGAEVLAPWRGPEERAGIVCFRLPGEDPRPPPPVSPTPAWWSPAAPAGSGCHRTPPRRRTWRAGWPGP